jgi:hypothetical protein
MECLTRLFALNIDTFGALIVARNTTKSFSGAASRCSLLFRRSSLRTASSGEASTAAITFRHRCGADTLGRLFCVIRNITIFTLPSTRILNVTNGVAMVWVMALLLVGLFVDLYIAC